MSEGFPYKPKILRGAFVEYGLSIPPLLVAFQFNPEELSRSRSITFSPPNQNESEPRFGTSGNWFNRRGEQEQEPQNKGKSDNLRDYHKKHTLDEIQQEQEVTIEEESISFDIRLDATGRLNDGHPIAQQFGIAPQLAALEMMAFPKEESGLGKIMGNLLDLSSGFSFTKQENPPMILFIWGRKRVLPVNINSFQITESKFSTSLNPVRATINVNLTVIEGKNKPYNYSKLMEKTMAALNLANVTDIPNVVIPG